MTVTKMQSESAVSPAMLDPRPRSHRNAAPESADATGQRKVRTRLSGDARRQAMSGPIPVRASSGSPKITRKKS